MHESASFIPPSVKLYRMMQDFFFFFLNQQYMEVLRPGIESEPQLLQTMQQLQQCWILNPLCWARDQTCASAETPAIADTMLDP